MANPTVNTGAVQSLNNQYKQSDDPLPVNYRFAVYICPNGQDAPKPIDICFQKVSGLKANLETEEIREGGENRYKRHFPTGATYDPLRLERGMVRKMTQGSPTSKSFSEAMYDLKIASCNIFVSLLDADAKMMPNEGWLFLGAYPKSWEFGDLDATSSDVLIETLEFVHNGFTTKY